jgi:hypothetical protein
MSKASLKKFLAGGRNSRLTVGGTADVRVRGGMQRTRSGDDLGDGLDLDSNGRAIVQVDPRGVIKFGPNGLTVDTSKLAPSVAETINQTTNIATGGGGGGGGGTTIINQTTVDDILPWLGW